MKLNSQKGVSVLFAMMIMAVILSVVLGLSTILAKQFKTLSDIGSSVVAFNAADTGIERVLQEIIKNNQIPTGTDPVKPGVYLSANGEFSNNASYEVRVVCPISPADPLMCAGVPSNNQCFASQFCIRSTGLFQEIKRGVEVNL